MVVIDAEVHPVAAARLEMGLSQRAFADLVGVTQQAVSLIEAGKSKPGLQTAWRIAEAAGKDVKDLFPELTGGEA